MSRCRNLGSYDYNTPGSRHNPKIRWVDDAKVVGDGTSKPRPFSRDFFSQEPGRRVGEFGACSLGLVLRDVLVQDAPQPLDRIEMPAISRNEAQHDPISGPRQPFAHGSGVVILRVVEINADENINGRINSMDSSNPIVSAIWIPLCAVNRFTDRTRMRQ